MKLNSLKYRLYCVLLSLAAMVAVAACGSNEAEVAPAEPTYTISLTLRTNGIFTRANDTWGDEYIKDYGKGLDNVINSVDLFLLDSDNNISTRLYALNDHNGAVNTYVCNVTEKTPGVTIDKVNRVAKFTGTLKIMAVANVVSEYTPWIDGNDWKTRQIPFKVDFGISDSWYIPMWGINSYKDVEIKDKELKKLDDIDLLRAVSKIVIKLDNSISADYEIAAVTMAEESSQFYKGGYVLPSGAWDVTETTGLKLVECFNPTNLENIPMMASPKFQASSDSKTEVFTYVPESRITDDTPFAFAVTLHSKKTDRPDVTGILYLSNYSSDGTVRGEAYDNVVRNHIYEYTVKMKKQLIFTVDVKPYTVVELDPIFGI